MCSGLSHLIAVTNLRFDPGMAFVFYLFISNVIPDPADALDHGGPEHSKGRASDRRAQSDLDINIKAEQEVEVILQHLEYQNTILLDLVKKVDTTLADAVKTRHAQNEATRSAIETSGRQDARSRVLADNGDHHRRQRWHRRLRTTRRPRTRTGARD